MVIMWKVLLLAFAVTLAACDKQGLELRPKQDDTQEANLLINSSPSNVEKVTRISELIDRSQGYYLEIANTRPGSISTSSQTMRVLLQPDKQVTLSHHALRDGPWSNHLIRGYSSLTLALDEQLVLSITMSAGDGNEANYYQAKQPLNIGVWLQLFTLGDGEISQSVISTNKKELWLRLVEASQSH
jgi:hypothetical protein